MVELDSVWNLLWLLFLLLLEQFNFTNRVSPSFSVMRCTDQRKRDLGEKWIYKGVRFGVLMLRLTMSDTVNCV